MTNKKIERLSIKLFKGRMVRIMLTITSILLICVFICVGVLISYSTGKPKPFLDENGRLIAGSISEKIHVNINGVEQVCLIIVIYLKIA